MALDTSKMKIVCVDGYYRYVCHDRRILTSGFKKRAVLKLKRNAEGFSDKELAFIAMRERYDETYGVLR